MEILKKIARKILADEIDKLKDKCEKAESYNAELLSKMSGFKDECESNQRIAESKAEKLEKENEILRKYYDLDKEPSDEIKMKIHIDLEINRLKEENLKIVAMASTSRQPIYYMPPVYPFGRGF